MIDKLPTIAAISTPLGESGLGVIRISGIRSLEILSLITKTKKKNILSRKSYLKILWDKAQNMPIEQAVVTYYKAPKSYTGEDMAEISTHGSLVLLKYILEIIIKHGAILSPPGEFSKRAFINGKMDLSQAEGVINLIKAKTKLSAGYAFEQVKGKLSNAIKDIRKDLIDVLAKIEVSLDFDEDMGVIDKQEFLKKIKKALGEIKKLKETYNEGRIIKEGIKILILGRPNVGKSTLLNALLREERAIVTNIPGTTRDTIEEAIDINGIPAILIDTAGLSSTKNYIEKLGQIKAKNKIIYSDLILFICEANKQITKKDEVILKSIKEKEIIKVFNKEDLVKGKKNNKNGIYISAKNGTGIEKIKKEIEKYIGNRIFERNNSIVLNVRHYECLVRAEESLLGLVKTIKNKDITLDLNAIELKEAIKALGEISGEEVSEEVINKIFEEFCIGK